MKKSSCNWVVIGKLGKAHGVKGLISVISYMEPRENILNYPDWFIKERGEWRTLPRSEVKVTPKGIFVHVDGYDKREEVATLTNAEISIPKKLLPALAEGDYYWDDLIGLNVKTIQNLSLGQVDSIISTGSNDVLIVCGEKRNLIPYLQDDVVKNVDLVAGEIIVDWDI